eukprot:TRINITY_DN611_c0_g1_i2.p2 TRINITY_DN611_c0_g1~~TRINITY_DN611_c0_g1_i2.p2  ORF type:complete len:162 (+),score=74.96 TRINITY_DN611_c0_g1_i2:68-553(+)
MALRATTRLFSVQAELQKQKMTDLYRLVTGEVQFKNKAPVKDSTITSKFGDAWRTELDAWFSGEFTKKMTPEDKTVARARLDKYLARLELTRYTSSELARNFSEGAHAVAANAEKENIAQAKEFMKSAGGSAFEAHVASEAKAANWSAEQTAAFIKKVQAA